MQKDIISKVCFEEFVKANNNLSIINQKAELLGFSLNGFLKIVQNYINIHIPKTECEKILNDLYNCSNNKQIITYLNSNNNINIDSLINNILPFFKNIKPYTFYLFPNKVIEFTEILLNYKKTTNEPVKTYPNSNIEKQKNIVMDFINSKYSLKRFCFNNNISLRNFRNYVMELKKEKVLDDNGDYLYITYINNLEFKENMKKVFLKQDVYKILEQIKLKQINFSLIDFCLLTNYDISEVVEEADKVLEDVNDCRLIRTILKSNLDEFCSKFGRKLNYFGEQKIFNLFKIKFSRQIDDKIIELQDEDKYAIISYLQSNNIPICGETFQECCNIIYKKKEELIKLK